MTGDAVGAVSSNCSSVGSPASAAARRGSSRAAPTRSAGSTRRRSAGRSRSRRPCGGPRGGPPRPAVGIARGHSRLDQMSSLPEVILRVSAVGGDPPGAGLGLERAAARGGSSRRGRRPASGHRRGDQRRPRRRTARRARPAAGRVGWRLSPCPACPARARRSGVVARSGRRPSAWSRRRPAWPGAASAIGGRHCPLSTRPNADDQQQRGGEDHEPARPVHAGRQRSRGVRDDMGQR